MSKAILNYIRIDLTSERGLEVQVRNLTILATHKKSYTILNQQNIERNIKIDSLIKMNVRRNATARAVKFVGSCYCKPEDFSSALELLKKTVILDYKSYKSDLLLIDYHLSKINSNSSN